MAMRIVGRERRKLRIRQKVNGTPEKPRLSVFRSGQHIYAQVIDDSTGRTVAAASSLEEALRSFQVTPKAAPAARSKAALAEDEAPVEMEASVAPAKGKGARVEKAAPKPQAKGAQQQKGAAGKGGKPAAQVKTLLPIAEKVQPEHLLKPSLQSLTTAK